MYDWASRPVPTSIERITHSICTLEFEKPPAAVRLVHPRTGPSTPRSRLSLPDSTCSYTIMSKRKLLELVQGKHVLRLGTTRGCRPLSGLRLPVAAIRPRPSATSALALACRSSTASSTCPWLEGALRDDLNKRALRRMAVLNPLRVVIENYPAGQSEETGRGSTTPRTRAAGVAQRWPFSRELFIEPRRLHGHPRPRATFRLAPGQEVRLRYGYFVTYTGHTTDPGHRHGDRGALQVRPRPPGAANAPDGRKVQGAPSNWVSATPCHRSRGAAVRPSA